MYVDTYKYVKLYLSLCLTLVQIKGIYTLLVGYLYFTLYVSFSNFVLNGWATDCCVEPKYDFICVQLMVYKKRTNSLHILYIG